jgi:hypothetical protein
MDRQILAQIDEIERLAIETSQRLLLRRISVSIFGRDATTFASTRALDQADEALIAAYRTERERLKELASRLRMAEGFPDRRSPGPNRQPGVFRPL